MLYFKTDESILVYFPDGNSTSWSKTSKDYERVCELAQKENWIAIEALNKPVKALVDNIENAVVEGSKIVLAKKNGIISEEAVKEIENSLNSPECRLAGLISLLKQRGIVDSKIESIKPFLQNIAENEFIDATTEIYDYCTKLDFEITEDGCILAYKNVNKDLTSCYDNATKHVIGEYTEVSDFDTNRNNYCSKGLHFCSKGYLSSYTGAKTIIVKVNPKDIISIPADHNFEKGRCRKYLTVGILDKKEDLRSPDIEEMKDVKLIKTEERRSQESEGTYKSRYEEAYRLMQELNDAKLVSEKMNISRKSVSKYIYEYKKRMNKTS